MKSLPVLCAMREMVDGDGGTAAISIPCQLGGRLHKREYRDPHPRGPFRSSYKPLIICKKLDTCPRLLVLRGYKAEYKLGTVGTPPCPG